MLPRSGAWRTWACHLRRSTLVLLLPLATTFGVLLPSLERIIRKKATDKKARQTRAVGQVTSFVSSVQHQALQASSSISSARGSGVSAEAASSMALIQNHTQAEAAAAATELGECEFAAEAEVVSDSSCDESGGL